MSDAIAEEDEAQTFFIPLESGTFIVPLPRSAVTGLYKLDSDRERK